MRFNIYLAGVGGQGLVTMATILGEAFIKSGIKAIVSEVHGLSQRGGALGIHIRAGDVESPTIMFHGADVVIALEANEAVRSLMYANERTVMLVNNRVIPVNSGKSLGLEEALGILCSHVGRLYLVNAYGQAIMLGDPVFENMVMLGAAYALTRLAELIRQEDMERSIMSVLKGRRLEDNIKAFRLGSSLIRSTQGWNTFQHIRCDNP